MRKGILLLALAASCAGPAPAAPVATPSPAAAASASATAPAIASASAPVPLPPATVPPTPAALPPGPQALLRCTARWSIPDIAGVVSAKWAPSGTALVLGSLATLPSLRTPIGAEEEELLWTFDLLTGARRLFAVGARPQWSGSGVHLSYWTPDGEQLHVARDGILQATLPATVPDARWVGDTLLYFEKDALRSWSGGATRTIARLAKELEPRYPQDDARFSADGQRFTIERYFRDGRVDRYVGITATGATRRLEAADATQLEWSPTAHTLLVRYADRLELRDDEVVVGTGLSRFAGPTHVWTADGKALLVGAASPALPGGDVFDTFTVWGAPQRAAAAILPNLLGIRSLSPNGELFAGTSRVGLDGSRLEIYGCGGGQAASTGALRTSWTASAASESRRLLRPVAGGVTQYFTPSHTGLDIAAPLGSLVVAAEEGTVSATGFVTTGGQRVCVAHAAVLETCYYHTAGALVRVGQRVARGQPIALVGMTGDTTGPHVHWEARASGRLVDPLTR